MHAEGSILKWIFLANKVISVTICNLQQSYYNELERLIIMSERRHIVYSFQGPR